MPARPRTASRAAAASPIPVMPPARKWDDYVAEVAKTLTPWRMEMPDGEMLEIGCPLADQVDALAQAQARGDTLAMLVAVFGQEWAPKLAQLTASKPWVLRLRLVDDVMSHFGMSLVSLPES